MRFSERQIAEPSGVPRGDALGGSIPSALLARRLGRSARFCAVASLIGNVPAFQTPAEFAAVVKADVARWAPVVKASGFVAED